MLKNLFYILSFFLFISSANAHHYKGLPHNDYFANYPQVPILEFLHEDDSYEIFLTIYNFQGINLESVEDNKMVRFYIFLYDVMKDTPYEKPTRFEVYSHGELIHTEEELLPEEESIYSIHKELNTQDDLELKVYFDRDGTIEPVTLPFRITKTFFQKYGILFSIVIFFLCIGIAKKFIIKTPENAS